MNIIVINAIAFIVSAAAAGNIASESTRAGYTTSSVPPKTHGWHVAKMGFINKDGVVVIEPKFDFAFPLCEGLAPVQINHKWGYIDRTGAMKIPPKFDSVGMFASGLAPVAADGKAYLIKKDGSYLFDKPFQDVTWFSHGLAAAKEAGKWGFIDRTGTFVVPPTFDELRQLRDQGLAAAKQGNKWGYVDRTGKWIIEPKFDRVDDFFGPIAIVTENKTAKFINPQGADVLTGMHPPENANSGFAYGFVEVRDDAGKLLGLMNQQGRIVLPPKPEWNSLRAVAEDRAVAAVAGADRLDLINIKTGDVIVRDCRLGLNGFEDGLAAVSVGTRELGAPPQPTAFIDKQGNVVIPPKFHGNWFSEGLATFSVFHAFGDATE
jgi:hypothetical protein